MSAGLGAGQAVIFREKHIIRQKMKNCSHWILVPIIVTAFATVGFWTIYILAHRNRKICSLDLLEGIAGDTPPESCIFSQVLNMTAFLVTGTAVLRYSQLKAKVMKPWLNIFGLITLSLSSFGMTIVANFQLSNNRVVHNLGSLTTITFGTAACWIQAVLTFQGNINKGRRKLGILRVILSVVITVGFITYLLLLAHHSYLHGARVQWTAITCLLLYQVTFAVDFKHYAFEIHAIERRTTSTENLSNNRVVHNLGSLTTITFGTAACWIQAVLTFQGNINKGRRKLGILRVILSVVITVGFITYLLLLAHHSYLHGARVQWTAITCLLLYQVTFAVDFKHYAFEIHAIERRTTSTENVSNI